MTLVISNSMGPWNKFESTVVRLKRNYEDTGSEVCLTTKGRQLERNFEELKPVSHVPILGTILNIFDVFVAVFSLSVNFRVLVHIVSFALLCVGHSILIIQNCLHYTKRERSLYATY